MNLDKYSKKLIGEVLSETYIKELKRIEHVSVEFLHQTIGLKKYDIRKDIIKYLQGINQQELSCSACNEYQVNKVAKSCPKHE